MSYRDAISRDDLQDQLDLERKRRALKKPRPAFDDLGACLPGWDSNPLSKANFLESAHAVPAKLHRQTSKQHSSHEH